MNKEKRKGKINFDRYGVYFILPYCVIFLIFGLVPILYTFYMSFTDMTGFSSEINLVGIKNYINVLSNINFYKSLWNTVVLWILSFIPNIVVSFLLAIVFTDLRLKFKGVSFFRTALYLPGLLMPAAVAILFSTIFSTGKFSVANQILQIFGGGPVDFPRSAGWMRAVTTFILFWMYFGNNLILIIAGFCGIDSSYYEAAEIDGASRFRTFFYITLPLMRSMVVYIAINSIIGGLQIFDIPFLMVDKTPDKVLTTITVMLYNFGFGTAMDYSYASTLAICQFVIIAVLSMLIFLKNSKKGEEAI